MQQEKAESKKTKWAVSSGGWQERSLQEKGLPGEDSIVDDRRQRRNSASGGFGTPDSHRVVTEFMRKGGDNRKATKVEG